MKRVVTLEGEYSVVELTENGAATCVTVAIPEAPMSIQEATELYSLLGKVLPMKHPHTVHKSTKSPDQPKRMNNGRSSLVDKLMVLMRWDAMQSVSLDERTCVVCGGKRGFGYRWTCASESCVRMYQAARYVRKAHGWTQSKVAVWAKGGNPDV